MTLKTITYFTSFLALLLFSNFLTNGQHSISVNVEGTDRSFLVNSSHGYDIRPLPLIVVLHENGVSPLPLAGMDWSKLRHRVILAFPYSTQLQWPHANDRKQKQAETNNDIKFIDGLISKLQGDFSIDLSRIFVIGIGNSYDLAQQFQHQYPQRLRATIQWNNKRSNTPSSENADDLADLNALVNQNPSTMQSGKSTFHTKVDTLSLPESDMDLLHIKYKISPLNTQGINSMINIFDVDIKYPILIKNNYKLFGRASYETLWTKDDTLFGGSTLHGISSQLALTKNIRKKTSLLLFGNTGVYSDFKDINGKDLRFSLGVRIKKRVKENFSYAYGLSYSRQFFGNQIVPFIEIDWQPNERVRVFGPFPVRPKIEVKVTPMLILGAGIQGDASSYRLSKKYNDSRFVQINQWGINLYGRKKIEKSLSLYAAVGYSLRRSFKEYNDTDNIPWTIITIPLGDRTNPISKINNNNYTFEIGLSYGLSR